MHKMRIVKLEFLRHGPPHNQLLSPLTEYLALCGNHSAASVRLPFEHHEWMNRLRHLRYEGGADEWTAELQLTSRLLTNILGSVPGLIAELSDDSSAEPPFTHLRLVLSASELALLPFELVNAPDGCPGAGHPLNLQRRSPICMTREVRRSNPPYIEWPRDARILFVAAQPRGVGPIPLRENYLALLDSLRPWLADDEEDGRVARIPPHLRVLTRATPDAIHRACSQTRFTHVHILAHGVEVPGEYGRFALALHRSGNRVATDYVDGTRLARLLQAYPDGSVNTPTGPTVVTIASCDSAQQGSVVGAGASIAHELHEAGVPLVVASQFPLSFDASVLMARVMYRGLLWGLDPRIVLNDLRSQLSAKIRERHDWASLTAYASLPDDLDTQLADVRFQRANSSIETTLGFLDGYIDSQAEATVSPGARDTAEQQRKRELAENKQRRALKHLRMLLRETRTTDRERRACIHGLLASTEKRKACITMVHSSSSEPERSDASDTLRRAQRHYAQAFSTDATQSWALTQELAISALLDGHLDENAWTAAVELSKRDCNSKQKRRRLWAFGNLIELYMLAARETQRQSENVVAAVEAACDYATKLKNQGDGTKELFSTNRQIRRYIERYRSFDNDLGLVVETAKKIVGILGLLDPKYLHRSAHAPRQQKAERTRVPRTSQDHLVSVNGIDGSTGQYLVSPQTLRELLGTVFKRPDIGLLSSVLGRMSDILKGERLLGLPSDIDPADVSRAGWAIVYAKGTSRKIRDALKPLVSHRRSQVDEDRFRELDYQPDESLGAWLLRHKVSHGSVNPTKVPYYILLVGPPTDISFRFQCELDAQHCVGRLSFESANEYRRYADSVVAYETSTAPSNRRTAVYWSTSHPNDSATQLSSQFLIAPLAEGTDSERPAAESSHFVSTRYGGAQATRANLLAELHAPGRQVPTAFLFTASHGVGWSKPNQYQNDRQGGLLCSDWSGLGSMQAEHYVKAADISDKARVFGMVAFVFACFGAGTPEYDSFPTNRKSGPRRIAEKPFVAALAQRLLSHPNGTALAVIGHVDRAWSYSIRPPGGIAQLLPYQNMISRILGGRPVGFALRDFRERALVLSSELLALYDTSLPQHSLSERKVLWKWIERNDAQHFVLLGDPAVRIRSEMLID